MEPLLVLCEMVLDNKGFTGITKISSSLRDTAEVNIFN